MANFFLMFLRCLSIVWGETFKRSETSLVVMPLCLRIIGTMIGSTAFKHSNKLFHSIIYYLSTPYNLNYRTMIIRYICNSQFICLFHKTVTFFFCEDAWYFRTLKKPKMVISSSTMRLLEDNPCVRYRAPLRRTDHRVEVNALKPFF